MKVKTDDWRFKEAVEVCFQRIREDLKRFDTEHEHALIECRVRAAIDNLFETLDEFEEITLKSSIYELRLNPRVAETLDKAGIVWVYQLLRFSRGELATKIRPLEVKSLDEIEDRILDYGWALKQDATQAKK